MIFIPGNVPSSKNGKQWTGKMLIHSKAMQKYIKNTKGAWQELKEAFLEEIGDKEKPHLIGMHFAKGTRHKFDWVNCVETIQDMMTHHGWIEDDNVEEMIPIPFKRNGYFYTVDKNNPGAYIKVYDR